ncbi:glycosyltransferase family 4 protein [Pontiellaceae bacterium B1224]|nr:glycosyltransferase family 4 protein [Pontiellaceae bacterium B1224]
MKTIVDVFISPLSNQMVFEEQTRFNAPERLRVSEISCTPSLIRGIGAIAPHADILLCPSKWVAKGVEAFVPEHKHKIRIVPYGSSIFPRDQDGVDAGRLLFAGRDPLRKGLPYFAEAVYSLRKSGIKLDARVAGLEKGECKWFPHYEELNYLGVVGMERMGDEYEKADAFVLPSLSEGQAGVVLEALSYGCPVIATEESGVDLTSFENGIIIPARSAAELANAVEKVVLDRSLREKLSVCGKEFFSLNFSMDMWRKRLMDIVQDLQD